MLDSGLVTDGTLGSDERRIKVGDAPPTAKVRGAAAGDLPASRLTRTHLVSGPVDGGRLGRAWRAPWEGLHQRVRRVGLAWRRPLSPCRMRG